MTETAAIQVEHMTFAYDGAPVLEHVDLAISTGDFAALVGPNGGGKTTLLKLVLGLLRPTVGAVHVFGERPEHVRSRVGYVPQLFHFDLMFPIRALDVVLMGGLHRGRWLGPYRRSEKNAALDALREVELVDQRARPFSALSGGQRQRVLIARALMADPELLLLDEPTASLDVRSENEVYELLCRLNERMTIVLATHDLGVVNAYVKSVVCIKRTVAVHPTSELTGEMISELYGGEARLVRHDHRCAEGGHEWAGSSKH
jgi:zinc transport system ATP-binding protein